MWVKKEWYDSLSRENAALRIEKRDAIKALEELRASTALDGKRTASERESEKRALLDRIMILERQLTLANEKPLAVGTKVAANLSVFIYPGSPAALSAPAAIEGVYSVEGGYRYKVEGWPNLMPASELVVVEEVASKPSKKSVPSKKSKK